MRSGLDIEFAFGEFVQCGKFFLAVGEGVGGAIRREAVALGPHSVAVRRRRGHRVTYSIILVLELFVFQSVCELPLCVRSPLTAFWFTVLPQRELDIWITIVLKENLAIANLSFYASSCLGSPQAEYATSETRRVKPSPNVDQERRSTIFTSHATIKNDVIVEDFGAVDPSPAEHARAAIAYSHWWMGTSSVF